MRSVTPDTQFEKIIGVPFDSRVRLVTSQKAYHAMEAISYQVINNTEQPLFFNEQSMGVAGYQYNPQTQQWESVDLGFFVGDPHPIIVLPSKQVAEAAVYSLPVFRIKASGDIRLVVKGRLGTNDSNVQVAAFTDIRVNQDNPEFVGKWEGYGGFSNRALPNGDDTFLKFNFSGEEITIGFSRGPEFGSAEVIVDGVSRTRICNYSQTYSNNNVTIDHLGQALHELRIYPRDDATCSQSPRYTQVLQFFVP